VVVGKFPKINFPHSKNCPKNRASGAVEKKKIERVLSTIIIILIFDVETILAKAISYQRKIMPDLNV